MRRIARSLRYRLANLLVDKLDRAQEAVDVYQDMIGEQPDDMVAIGELEVLLRRFERWREVRDVLEHRLDHVDGAERISTLEEIARLSEDRLDDVVDAIERFQRILSEQPDHAPSLAALERLLAKEERWQDLAEILDGRMQQQRDQDEDGFRLTASRLAELLAGRLHDTDRAQDILQQLLEVSPDYVPGLLALAAVQEAQGRDDDVRQTLDRAVALQPEAALGAQLQLRLAKLADEPGAKREHLEAGLQLDPTHPEVVAELLTLSRKEERWDQLVYLLELQSAKAPNEDKRRELTLERVDLMAARLGDHDGALRILSAIYDKVQDNPEINRRIANSLFAAERFDEAAGMYQWLVEVGKQGKRGKPLSHDLTRLARIELTRDERDAPLSIGCRKPTALTPPTWKPWSPWPRSMRKTKTGIRRLRSTVRCCCKTPIVRDSCEEGICT